MNLVLVINDDRKEFNVIAEKMSAMGEDLCRMTNQVEGAKEYVSLNHPELIFLDNDLDDDFDTLDHPNTGFKFAEWLVKQPAYYPALVIVTTMNVDAGLAISSLFSKHQITFVYCPFELMKEAEWTLIKDLLERRTHV